MRKVFQAVGRALLSRKVPTKPSPGPVDRMDRDRRDRCDRGDRNVSSPLPAPPPKLAKPPLCEFMSDLVKWQGIRLALQGMEHYQTKKPLIKPQDKSNAVLESNVVLPQPQEQEEKVECASSTESTVDEVVESKKPFVSTFDQLFTTTNRSTYQPINKISVIGASDVGMATVFSLLAKGVTSDISLVDFSEEKLKGELMDLQSGSNFLPNCKLRASKDFSITKDSRICVLTPCSDAAAGDKAYDCVRCNAEVLKAVVPQLLQYSPNCILVVALDPVDVLSYVAWRVSDLPRGRVVGTGTSLASAAFRYLLADRLGLAPDSCHGLIIGENGDSSVAVWSGVTAGGVLLRSLNPDVGTDLDRENWQEVHRAAQQSSQQVRDLKGYHSWAAALSITDICSAILNDANTVRPLSTYVKGEHNIDEDVFLSLPCVVGSSGVTDIIRQPLTNCEMELLHKSAMSVAGNLGTLKITQ